MTNAQGLKETFGKLNYELDFEFITALAERMDANKGKYPPYNWKLPMDVEKLKQALFRHVIDIMKDNYADDGRDFGHIEAAACDLMMILHQLKKQAKPQKSGRLIDFTNIEDLREIAFYKFINGENLEVENLISSKNNIFSDGIKKYLVLTYNEASIETRKKITEVILNTPFDDSIYDFANFNQMIDEKFKNTLFRTVLALDKNQYQLTVYNSTFYIYYVGNN